jgi:hypothetical protein
MTNPFRAAFTHVSAPKVYRVTAIAIFLAGVVIHSLRLVLGAERLSAELYTPPIDGAFGFLMLISAVAGWLSFRRFTGTFLIRVGFILGLAMITISVPIHLRALAIWSKHYIANFPPWYSIAEIPLFLWLSWIVTRLCFRR